MLVSVALTLLVVLAVVRVFSVLGNNVTDARSILELSGQLRNATSQLQQDLDHITARTLPPLDPGSAEGYLEIIEGIRSDRNNDGDQFLNPVDTDPTTFVVKVSDDPYKAAAPSQVIDPQFLRNIFRVLGDSDDVLMATIRSDGQPFTGRLLNRVIESQLAEVVWWVEPVAPTPGAGSSPGAVSLAIHRRALLIRPDLTAMLPPVTDYDSFLLFLSNNDLSVRPVNNQLVANSLEDLTNRENRFAHWPDNLAAGPAAYPFSINRNFLVPTTDGRDVILSDALAFDLRVFDRSAPLYRPNANSSYVLSPVDPGYYSLASTAVLAGHGAYVDLGYNTGGLLPLSSHFSNPPDPRSGLWSTRNINAPRVYCTWTRHYERDGIDQDRDGFIDEGTNGIDDDSTGQPGFGLVDDATEQETWPPYRIPLRGIEVLLRVQEFSTQQIRQASVVADFVPE